MVSRETKLKIQQKSIKKNFLYNIILNLLNIVFPLITFPYVSRVLSPEGIGKVDFSLSVVQYFILIALVGIPTYAVRECARYRDDKEKLTKTVQEILLINFCMIILSYILFVFVIFSVDSLRPYRILILIASFNIVSTSIGVEWFYQAIEEYKFITTRNIFFKLISLILIFILVKDENDYITYGFITVLSTLLGYIYNFIYANKYISLFRKHDNYEIKKHIKPILMLFAMSISVSIYINLDKVMLGFLSGDKAVGIYTAANKMIRVVLALVTSLGTVLLPRMSYYIEKNDNTQIKNLINKSLNFILMLSIPSAIGIFILARPIILLLAGQDYLEAIPTIRIICPIILAIALSNLIGIQILISYKKERITLISTIIGAIVNFSLNMILIPYLQQDGAAIGTLIAEWVVTLVQIIFAYKYIKDELSLKNILTYICGGILIILAVFVVKVFVNNIWLLTMTSVVLGIAIYFAFLYLVKNMLVYEIANNLLNRLKVKFLSKQNDKEVI